MRAKFVDLHNDAVGVLSPRRFLKYIRRAARAGVGVMLASVWTSEMREPLSEIRRAVETLEKARGVGVELFLHIEDAWFVDEDNIGELLELKPFSVGLTWNADNALAGGANGSGGLTELGRAVIEKLVDGHVVIDLAHLNRQSFYQVAEVVVARGGQIFCSHACFDEVNPHPRNLDRAQIQTIVEAGGVVGLTLVGEFLTSKKRAGREDVYRHIKYFLDNFGEGGLCVGTDFFGTTNLPKGLRRYRDFKRFRRFLRRRGIESGKDGTAKP